MIQEGTGLKLTCSSLLFLITLLLAEAPAVAFQNDALTARVDQVFAEWNKPDSPGCALAVVKQGRIIYKRGYGMADLEHDAPISPASVFYIGSVSKQFTAMAVALLARQGKLSLDDDVRKYIPELPDYGAPITARHLIHHTSGLRDYNTLLALAGRRGDEAFNNDVVLEITSRQKGLNFPPGEQFLYSNTGYALLAVIVERVSGMKLSAFAEENIFKPLGMTNTHFHDDLSRIVKNRAYGYGLKRGGGFLLDTPYNERSGAGGVFTTAEDLFKWDQSFYDGHIGGPEFIRQLETPGRLNNGRQLDYAFGLTVSQYRGLRVVQHGGSLGGYRAHLLRFPEQKFSVICLCNLSSINPGRLANQVAEIYLGDQMKQSESTENAGTVAASQSRARNDSDPVTLTPAQLEQYMGDYYSDELQATYKVVLDGGKLYFQHKGAPENPLAAVNRDVFTVRSMRVNFKRDTQSRVTGFTLDAGRVINLQFVKK